MKNKHVSNRLVATVLMVGVIGGFLTVAFSYADAPGVYDVPASIARDCSADVAAELETWIASVPNSSTINFPAGGCYRSERYIKLIDRVGLIINGNGSKLQRTQLSAGILVYPKPNPHLWILRGSNITVRNLSVAGTNTTSDLENLPEFGTWYQPYEFEAAIRAERTANVTIDNLNVYGVWGDGVQLSSGNGAVVTNVTVDKNGRQGISIQNEKNVLIDNAKILHSRRGGIDLENSGINMSIDNVEIRNSTLSTWLLAFPAGGRGPVNNIFIHHNTVTRTGIPFIANKRDDLVVHRFNWRIEDNAVTYGLGSPQPAIVMYHTDNITVVRNTLRLKPGRSEQALYFSDAQGSLIVKDNYFQNAASVYTADVSSAAVTACNNKLVATGAFDQPAVCGAAPVPKPPVQAPIPQPNPGVVTPPNPTNNGGSSPKASTTSAPNSSTSSSAQPSKASVTDSKSPSVTESITHPVSLVKNSFSSVTDPEQPLARRISISAIWWLILAAIMLFGIWAKKRHLIKRLEYAFIPIPSDPNVVVGHFEHSHSRWEHFKHRLLGNDRSRRT